MNKKYGLVSWDDPEFKTKKVENTKKEEFVKFKKGETTTVRILTAPHQYIFHKWKPEGLKGYGEKIMCTGKDDCLLCQMDVYPSQRWYVGVIDRGTQSYKVLDMSPSLFKLVQGLNKNPRWGNPSKYDLDITTDPEGTAATYYSVAGDPDKTPLSDNDLRIKSEDADIDALMARCKPPQSIDGIVKYVIKNKLGQSDPDAYIASALEEAAKKKAEREAERAKRKAATASTAVDTDVSVDDESEEGPDFPDANEQLNA